MTEDDIVGFLEGASPGAKRPALAFDTNAIFGDHPDADPGVELIDTINRANELRGAAPRIAMVIPAVVLHEKLRQMGQRYGARFDVTLPLRFLSAKNLVVKGFGAPHAIGIATRLQRLYPKQGDWRAFKKRRCLECLGLPATTTTKSDGSKCGATVDWLIVGHPAAKGYLLITDDAGPEFQGVSLAAPLSVSLAAARRVLRARGA
jgi:hypothetical protein